MTQIVYGRSRPAFTGSRQWKNGRLFTGPVEGAAAVFLDGAHPEIRAAYEKLGVPVHDGLPDPLDHDGDGKPGGAVSPPKTQRGGKPALDRRRRKVSPAEVEARSSDEA